MSKSIVIVMDLWSSTSPSHVDNIVKKINSLNNIEAVFFTTYSKDGTEESRLRQAYHPSVRQRLNVYSEELIPPTYDISRYKHDELDRQAERDILLLEKMYDFDNIIYMGGTWKICVHLRSYGINNIKKVLPYKEIIVYPECMYYE